MKNKAPLGRGMPTLAQGRGREVVGGIQAHGLGALIIIFCSSAAGMAAKD
ncbi:hypothetical protein [Comamonas sp. CAH-2]|jgi:hypothetical protein|nr:hypothetical protein [Comamonas sp. CAH-2]